MTKTTSSARRAAASETDGHTELIAPPVTERVLDQIVARIVRHADPERIILFGSRAWGQPQEDSDVDLLVITSHDGSSREQAIALHGALTPRLVSIDILVRTPAQIAERLELGDPFVKRIVERGRPLYDREIAAARR